MTVSKSNALLTVIGRRRGTIAILAPNGKFPGLRPSMTHADVLEYLVSPLCSSSLPILTNFIKMCSASALHVGAKARKSRAKYLDQNWDTSLPEPRAVASLVCLICTTFASSPDSDLNFRDLDPQSGLAFYLASILCRRIRTIGDYSSSGENVAVMDTDFVTCLSGMAREGDILCYLDGCYDSNNDSYGIFVIARPSVGQNQESKTEIREPGSIPLDLALQQAYWVEEGMRVIYCRFVTCQLDQSVYPSDMVNTDESSYYQHGEDVIFAIY